MLFLMVTAAATAHVERPTIYLADQRAKVNLEDLVPSEFGDWRELKQSSGQIINPQQTELLKKLYSQTLTRSYANSQGIVIMLSIAYGASQSDGVALHYPEVCYPAQGFQLQAIANVDVRTEHGSIPAKQLMTRLGNRNEPVTYWSTLGDTVVRGGMNTKLAQLEYGFAGKIPDGLIFRVSSINRDPIKGYADQTMFIQQFLASLPPPSRLQLAGLSN
jgi:EpsI family protein